MVAENAADVQKLWTQRAMFYAQDHRDMDTMVSVYDGNLPAEFDDFFHEEMHVHLINNIRLSWDDLAGLCGKEFPIFVHPEGNTPTQKDRAEKLEQIGYGWNAAGRAAGGISMKALMKVLSWWLIGTANSVAMVLPDYDHQTPYFTWRDPRTFYPPVGWSPWNETRCEDALFAYRKPISQLLIDYPNATTELRASVHKIYNLGDPSVGGRTGLSSDETWMWVGEYYHEDHWIVTTLDDKPVELVASHKGDRGHPGVQPVVAASLYSGSGTSGRSMFADQVSIQAAMARMFSQRLDFYDRTLYPLIFTTPLAGKTVKIGPYAVNEFDVGMGLQPRVEAIGPTHAMDADQTMAFAQGMSRLLNRNPEQMQGSGDANSAKALEALGGAVSQTVKEGFWPSLLETLPTLYQAAACMDLNLWGDVSKRAVGTRKNARYNVPYRPRTILKGHESDFELNPGVGLAGYQGTLEIMQLVGAELMPEDDAFEQLESVKEPQATKRRIQADRMEKLIWATLGAKAQAPPGTPGGLKAGAMAKIRKETEGGKDLFDVIAELEASGELYESMAPPAPPGGPMGPGGPGAPPGGGGLDPNAPGAAGTGSAASFLGMPTLEALRGGPGQAFKKG